MSQQNVDIVKRAINSKNQRALDAVMRVTDPEIEVDWSRSQEVRASSAARTPHALRPSHPGEGGR